MNSRKIQQVLFASLFIMSISSSVYLNDQAEELRTQGFEISYFSAEDAELIMPDVKFVEHFVDKLVGSFKFD